MSFEPDTSDIAIRQLREEIARIREEQFTSSLPTNNVGSSTGFASSTGVPTPSQGVTHVYPRTVDLTKDTGVIDLLKYDALVTDFVIGETITGFISGATAEIGDIDLTTSTTGTLTLVPNSLTGSFDDDENITGDVSGDADADGDEFTQTGRGHLNAGAGSTIVNADQVSTPFEIHFIDGANQDGQTMYIRAIEGQTIKLRRAVTNDGNTGNLDLDESFDIVENALVFFQFQVASNATEDGGWVPLLSNVTTVAGGTGSQFQFPILYPKENLGTLNGVIDLALNQSDGHYKQITLDGDASLTFSSLPPAINGFKFYVLTIQDATGGWVYTDLPDSVLFESSLLSQLQTDPLAQTLWQFSTADGGTNWHAQVVNPTGGANQTPWLSDIDADTFSLLRLDQIRFFGAGGFSFPTDETVQGIATSGSGLQFNVPLSQSYRFYVGGEDVGSGGGEFFTIKAQGSLVGFEFHDKTLHDVGVINFTGTTSPSFTSTIFPFTPDKQLQYLVTGEGSNHAFFADNISNPSFEIRKDEVKSNVDLNMVTNNIFDVDQVQFSDFGGFSNSADHGIRTITGGNEGIVVNIPIGGFPSFNVYFENLGLTGSDLEYRFTKSALFMNMNDIKEVQSITFTNGTSYFDQGLLDFQIITGLRTGSNPAPQVMQWFAKEQTGVDTYIDKQIFEITGQEDGTGGVGGGFKLFTDINMQTQNIHNIDIATWEPDVGTGANGLGNGSYGIVADESGFQTGDKQFVFSIPIGSDSMSFQRGVDKKSEVEIRWDGDGSPKLRLNSFFQDTSVEASQWLFTNDHAEGTAGMVDGIMRLISAGGGISDIIVGTGDKLVNLSEVGSQTPWLQDVDANTFNLINLDTLRYTPAGASGHDGVIGFGEYGSAVDPSGFLKWSVPSGESYEWQHNLEQIATLNPASFIMRSNSSVFNTVIAVEGSFIVGTVHTQGTNGIVDGEQRLITGGGGGSDVVFGSGGNTINLSTLGAGGGDNLGNHLATQPLDMNTGVNNNPIINFEQWLNSFGQSWIAGNSGLTWFIPSGDDFIFNIAGSDQLRVNLGEVQIFNNVLSWENSNDFIVNDGSGFILNSEASTDEFKFKSGGIDRFLVDNNLIDVFSKPFNNFVGWTAGVGQGLTVSGSGLLWDIDSSDTYEFRAGGSNVFTVSGVGSAFNGGNLNLNSNKIVGVADPTDALDAVNLQTLQAQGGGGDASQWSTFPALQNVDMDNFILSNTGAVTGLINGSGLFWTTPGVDITGGSFGLINSVGSSDTIEFRFGGVSRVAFSNVGHSFRGGNINVNLNRIVNVEDPVESNDAVNLQTLNSAVGGGGDFVTTNTFQSIPATKTWTGVQTYTANSHSINSPNIFIGDSSSDTVFVSADIGTSLIPSSNNSRDLGSSGAQWRNLFIDGTAFIDILSMGGNIAMTGFKITNLGTPTNSSDGATKAYVDSQVGGGSFVTTNTSQSSLSGTKSWTGFHSWTGDIRVGDDLEIDGDLNHDGPRIGFFGRTPTSKGTVNLQGTALFQVVATLADLLNQLEAYGLINTNV